MKFVRKLDKSIPKKYIIILDLNFVYIIINLSSENKYLRHVLYNGIIHAVYTQAEPLTLFKFCRNIYIYIFHIDLLELMANAYWR